jgi:hypothetical protein
MSATVDLPQGCILDRSHASALDLDLAIVRLAELYGFPHLSVWPNGRPYSPEDEEYPEVMRDLADGAVDWLNERAPEGLAYVVEDNSLFLWPIDED